MRIKKHLVAATLAVGLAGSAAAVGPSAGPANVQVGYYIAQTVFNNNPVAQAASQGGGAAAGGLFGAWVGAKAGAKFGAAVGAVCGPVGAVIGAVGGAV